MYRKFALAIGIVALLGMLALTQSNAQVISGDLVGTVLDKTGAVVPGASIEATNAETGVKYETRATEAGAYRFSNLPVGTYNVSATTANFATTTINGFRVELNKTSTLQITLEVKGAVTSIEVSGAPAALDTTTAQLQTTFESKVTADSAIASTGGNGSGVLNLSLLSAGVATSGGVGVGTGPSIGGQRPRNNNFTIEGVDKQQQGRDRPSGNRSERCGSGIFVVAKPVLAGVWSFVRRSIQYRGQERNEFVPRSGLRVQPEPQLRCVRQLVRRRGLRFQSAPGQQPLRWSAGRTHPEEQVILLWKFRIRTVWAGRRSRSCLRAHGRQLSGDQFDSGIVGDEPGDFHPICDARDDPTSSCGTMDWVGGTTLATAGLATIAPAFTNYKFLTTSMDYNISTKDQIRGRYIWNSAVGIDTAANLPAFFTPLPNKFHLVTLNEYHTVSPTLTK
jgi:hypothetical protein